MDDPINSRTLPTARPGSPHTKFPLFFTVGDPFKDTSSVALNPVIKFTTLFGLLAVELAIHVKEPGFVHTPITIALAIIFFLISMFFVYRSFYGMMIRSDGK